MSIISKEIKIFFNSNFQTEKIEFDLSKLYDEIIVDGKTTKLNTSGLNKLPYFTLSVKYPLNKLLKNLKSYQERVEFFFDKKKFENILFLSIDKSDVSINDEPSVIGEHNVMVMIELLFPTKFTVINNFHTSYDHIFDNSSLKRMLINPLTQKNYSYLKLSDGKIYTFIRLVWLNDLLNHPKYKEFFDNFIIFWNWYKRETRKITIKENGIIDETIGLIDEILKNIENEKKEVIDEVIKYSNQRLKEINDELSKLTDKQQGEKKKLNGEMARYNKYISDNKQIFYNNVDKTITDLQSFKQNLNEGKILDLKKIDNYFKLYATVKKDYPINKKTEEKLIKINSNIPLIQTETANKQKYEDLITATSEKYTTSSYGEYRTFIGLKNKYTNDKYSYPKYISSNEKLKEFFDKTDSDGIRQFFNIFEKIYNIYIAGTSDKLTPEEEAILKDIMNTSVNIIYPDSNSYLSSYSNASYYEIYIMADFIQGKVDDTNSNEIFCPYVGDYLGNMFELLFQLQLYGKSDKQDIYRWDVTRNRVAFSIENMELKTGELKDQLVKKPLENQTNNQTMNDKPINKPNNKINVSKFINDVYSNNKELDSIIDKLKKYQIYINESSFLTDIKKYNESLYNIIVESYNDESNYNVKLSKKINELKSKYDGDNKFNKDTIESKKAVNGYDPNKIIKIEQNIIMNELYIEILKKLYEIENKKNKNISVGGTKKRRVFKKKYQTHKKYRL
jgi:hypothetical protein